MPRRAESHPAAAEEAAAESQAPHDGVTGIEAGAPVVRVLCDLLRLRRLALGIEAVALVEGAPAGVGDEQAGSPRRPNTVRKPDEHPAEQESRAVAPAGA